MLVLNSLLPPVPVVCKIFAADYTKNMKKDSITAGEISASRPPNRFLLGVLMDRFFQLTIQANVFPIRQEKDLFC
jgi:hypothetical protein